MKKKIKSKAKTSVITIHNIEGQAIKLGRDWAVQQAKSVWESTFRIKRTDLKAALKAALKTPSGYYSRRVQLYRLESGRLVGPSCFIDAFVSLKKRTLFIGCNSFTNENRRKFLAWARATKTKAKAKVAAAGRKSR